MTSYNANSLWCIETIAECPDKGARSRVIVLVDLRSLEACISVKATHLFSKEHKSFGTDRAYYYEDDQTEVWRDDA